MNEEYFEWLLTKAGVDDGENGYRLLCQIMHEAIFYPLLEMDENRWEDGVAYRKEFAGDRGAYQLDAFLGGCTMLELIISLAEKISFEMQGSMFEAGTGKWFYEIIENLGLDIYTDTEIMTNENAFFEVDAILERVIFRKYSWTGEGGMFPLKNADEDQRTVEIEIQKNRYLMENYDIFGG